MSCSDYILRESGKLFIKKPKIKGPYRVCKSERYNGHAMYLHKDDKWQFFIPSDYSSVAGVVFVYDIDMNLVYCENCSSRFRDKLSYLFSENNINSAYIKNPENVYYVSFLQCDSKYYNKLYSKLYFSIYSPYLNCTSFDNLEYDKNNRIDPDKYKSLEFEENDKYIILDELNFSNFIKVDNIITSDIPDEEGVYIFYNYKKEVMYIGKAFKLRRRAMQHILKHNYTRSKVSEAIYCSKKNIIYYRYAKTKYPDDSFLYEEAYQILFSPKLENYSYSEFKRGMLL